MLPREGQLFDVIHGKQGRLFFGSQAGFDLTRFVSGTPFDERTLMLWRQALTRRAQEFKRRGVVYAIFITPDAHSICKDDLPDSIDSTFTPPGDVFLDAMKDIPDILFVDPRPALQAAKGLLEIYRKTESHWTQYGSFIAYNVLCDALAPFVDITRVPARDVTFQFRRILGDLGVMVEPEVSEMTPMATVLHSRNTILGDNDGVGRINMAESRAPTARPCRAVIFRDSYMTDVNPYMMKSFSDILMAGTTTRMFFDLVDEWKPDVVISQLSERRLFLPESDHQMDTFDDVFRTDYRSARGRKALQAMLRLRHGAPAEALAFIQDFDEDAGLSADHAYVAAQICMANLDFARGDRLMTIARAARPDRPSYLIMAAQLKLGLQQLAEAAELAERAVRIAPFNGNYHEVYVYVLIQQGRFADALRHLEAILPGISDSSVLWYWASVVRDIWGDRSGAFAAATQALAFHPDHTVYQEQLARLSASVAAD